MEPIETIDYKNHTINVCYDDYIDDYANPRINDNLGTIACWHRNYILGDEMPKISSKEFIDDLPKNTIILPVYMYDHSGITINTSGFSCPWDSGQVGIIYVTPDKLKEEKLEHLNEEEIEGYLKQEIKIYDQYLTGEIYCYEILDSEGEMIDSCSCYYDTSSCLKDAKSTIDYMVKTVGYQQELGLPN